MANLIAAVDAMTERRRKYIASVQADLSPFHWLQAGHLEHLDTSIAWAAAPSAPISSFQGADGTRVFVLGTVNPARASKTGCARYLWQLVKDKGAEPIAAQDGFYLAITWDAEGTISVGTDVLGLFPLYYHSTPDSLLVSTTPSLFRSYPLFSNELSPRGLAGILLTMHIVGGHSLQKGVRRLSFGHVLTWQRGKGSTEKAVDGVTPSCAHFGDTYQEQLDRFDRLLRNALKESTPNAQVYLLLSGGLDSRLLAGYLSDFSELKPVAVTLGKRSDNEMRFASRVARRLGWPHERVNVDLSTFAEFAGKAVELEQLSNGFNDLSFFSAAEQLHRVSSPEIITGFAGDIVMGGSHIRAGYDNAQGLHSFEAKFRWMNRYGFSPEQITNLVPSEILGDGLDNALEDLREAYHSIPGLPFQRTWMFDMNHRVRYHTAASIAWRISFGSWPIMPYVDREILDAAFGMPVATLQERRAQIDLLCSHFPSLASLPLDRMTLNTRPLRMSIYRRALSTLAQKSRYQYRKTRALQLLGIPVQDPRFYSRVFDINNAGWSGVRDAAEQFRVKAEKVLNRQSLSEWLPPPHVPIPLNEATVDGSSRKVLLAFMLWAGKNL